MLVFLSNRCRRFCDDISGGITAFTIMVFILVFVAVGMAVDFMRHETYRAELQDALDRGVLAAAAFSQTVDAEQTVRAYMKSTNYVKHCYHLDPIKTVQTTGSRVITASASCPLNTYFLKLVGIPKLDVLAKGTAIEGATKIEVSLVLDISTSMVINNSGGTSQTRLEVLQSSANTFMDLMFSGTNNNRLSMSLVPFAGQVNAGQTAFNYLNDTPAHSYSHCIEFDAADFTYFPNVNGDKLSDPATTAIKLPPYKSRGQMQHFNFSKFQNSLTGQADLYGPEGVSNVDWGWCPTDAQRIEYFATDKDVLKARIAGLRTHEATGTYYGARWGAMLLDPSANDLTASLVAANEVSSDQSELPRSYSDVDVQKFLIIMSDGSTTGQVRIPDHKYDEQVEIDQWASQLSSNQNVDFQRVDETGNVIFNGPTVDGGFTNDPAIASREAARIAFRNICETSKDNGVVVFTIGFDIDPDLNTATQEQIASAARAKSDLAACATSSSHSYDVQGAGLLSAFSAIASTIQKLKLLN